MPNAKAALSPLETTTLMQVQLRARIDDRLRVAARRLLHLGLVDESPDGFRVTEDGARRVREEAKRLGLA